jgi:signal transduction histidine kinase/CheY-like chemotaxis protein
MDSRRADLLAEATRPAAGGPTGGQHAPDPAGRPAPPAAPHVRVIAAGGRPSLRHSEGEIGGVIAHVPDVSGRARQLEALRAVSAQISRELDPTELFQRIAQGAADLTGGGEGVLWLWDEAEGVLVPHGRAGVGAAAGPLRLGEEVPGRVAAARVGTIARDDPHGCVLAEPVVYRDRVLGVLSVGDPARTFDEEDRGLIGLFAVQAAIAIENARLHEDAVRRGAEREALLSAARSVMSDLDLQPILERIATDAAEISRCPHVKLLLVDDETRTLQAAVVRGRTCAEGFPLPIGSGLSGRVAETGLPLYVADTQTDPRSVLAAQDRALGICTYLGLPIKLRGRVLGVLTFNTLTPHGYTGAELSYLASFADLAAVAIGNAQHHAAAQARADELESLSEIERAMMARLDLPAVLEAVVAGAARLLGGEFAQVAVWDEDARELRFGAASGPEAERVRSAPFVLGRGVNGAVAAQRKPMILNDYPSSPYLVPECAHVRATITVPICFGDHLLGVLHSHATRAGRRFSAADLRRLEMLGAHAAVAIENARLFEAQQAAYRELQRAKDELVRSEKLRALGQMAAGIAHDLNNMLAAILGQAELLRLRCQLPEIQEGLQTLFTAASDGTRVVQRLQDFSRQGASTRLVPCDLAALVREALELTRPRWEDDALRSRRPIQVWTAVENLPPILGNAAEIREVLTNLILNAVDAMPTGGALTISGDRAAAGAASGPGAPGVRLAVGDTGIGMSADVRSHVFDPFFTTKGVTGTGLGLAVVYGILQRHGGRIDVESTPGKGTTFTLGFQAAGPEHAIREAENPAASLQPKHICVIDDEDTVRSTTAALLEAAGHTVITAADGPEGLALVAAHPVDLVITDLGMPGMTGWEVAERLKAADPRRPVILLTGWGQQVSAGPARTHVDRILAKPIHLSDLQRSIAEVTAQPAAL